MLYCRVTSVTFRVLEPYAMKVASTVLRRERRGNPPDLSGLESSLYLDLQRMNYILPLTKPILLSSLGLFSLFDRLVHSSHRIDLDGDTLRDKYKNY